MKFYGYRDSGKIRLTHPGMGGVVYGRYECHRDPGGEWGMVVMSHPQHAWFSHVLFVGDMAEARQVAGRQKKPFVAEIHPVRVEEIYRVNSFRAVDLLDQAVRRYGVTRDEAECIADLAVRSAREAGCDLGGYEVGGAASHRVMGIVTSHMEEVWTGLYR